MDRRQFWSTKNPAPQYQSVVLEHPGFAQSFRLVANQFAPVTLGGFVHQPAPMTIKEPDRTGDGSAKLTLAFPRAVVGREFKRQLKIIRGAGSRAPIVVRYAVYLDDLTTPAIAWTLFADEKTGIGFNGEAVQVVATANNTMRQNVGMIYDPASFTGLELI